MKINLKIDKLKVAIIEELKASLSMNASDL
jgi:hypothetical protein